MSLRNLCASLSFIVIVSAVSAIQAAPIDVLASANGGVADINGVSGPGSGGFGTVAANFNDGNTDGNYGDGSIAHSTSGMVGNYMEVTLPGPVPFKTVELFDRTDCCDTRIDNGGATPYTLTIYNGAPGPGTVVFTENLKFSHDITGTNLLGQIIDLPNVEYGNVIRITQNNNDYENLAELEAFAVPEPSSFVGLLGLGAAGLAIAARRRKA